MRGAKRVAVPPNPKPSVWDPQIILDVFKSRAHPTTFFAAAAKALALLLLATGFRIDDVSKLSLKVEVFSSSLRVPFIGLRKPDIRGVPSSHLDLEMFPDVSICPVRAILRYLSILRKIRKKNQLPLCVIKGYGGYSRYASQVDERCFFGSGCFSHGGFLLFRRHKCGFFEFLPHW